MILRYRFLGVAFFCFLVFLFFVLTRGPFGRRVCFGDACLTVEVAQAPEERSRGLMFRRHMPPDYGMIFLFPGDDFWAFWMKNTYIPLDIIWVDRDKTIVDMRLNVLPSDIVEPPVLRPAHPARYVVEANAGFAQKNHIQVGDRLRFQ